MSNVESFSEPKAVAMADEWFQLATADHFWMQWRHSMLARALKRAGVYLCLGHWPVTHLDYWGMYGFALNHTWLESSLLKHGGHSLFFPSFLCTT